MVEIPTLKHKYIWFRGGDLNHYKVHFRYGVGYDPRGSSYKAFNLPNHPDHKYIWFKVHYSPGPRVIPYTLPEVNVLMVEIPTLKPYMFMIRVTRQIKCLIARAPRGHTPPHT
jgi:hypothetical protein